MVPQQVSGRLRRRPVSDAGQCSLTSALSARDSQAAQTQGPLPWPAQTLLQPLARPQSQMGQGEPGEGVHKSQCGVVGHSQGWSPQLWSLLTPHALGCCLQPMCGLEGSKVPTLHPGAPGTVSCMATPVSSAVTLLANCHPADPLEEFRFLATLQSQPHLGESTYSDVSMPATRHPSTSSSVEPSLKPAGGHQEPNQTPVLKYHPCQCVYTEENP